MRFAILPVLVAAVPALAHAEPPPPEPIAATDAFEIRQWFALGSGCRALPDGPADVAFDVAAVRGEPGRYRVTIHYARYRLDTDRPVLPGLASFARECGVRFALHPKRGKRLSAASANATFAVTKDRGARVRLQSRLLVGPAAAEHFQAWIPRRVTGVSLERPVRMRAPDQAFETVQCEQPKILGLDLSAAAVRGDTTPAVTVDLEQGVAVLEIEIEDCPNPQRSDR